MNNKISIGIPTYNQGKYIEETILSCLNQTIKPYEIVVSNNHCTDETDSILEKYKDKIKIVRPPKFLTMTENYQFLLDNLSGDWYMHIDSDDVLEPNAVEEVSKYTDDSNVVLIRYGVNLIDANSNMVKKGHPLRSVWKRESFPHNFYEQLSHSVTPSPGRTIRISTLRKVGGFKTEVKIAGDWATFLSLSPYGDFVNTGKVLSNYRIFPDGGKGLARIDIETADHAFIVKLEKEIIDKFQLKVDLWKKAKISIARKRFFFHQKYQHPFDPSIFEVTKEDIFKFNKWDMFLLKIRESFIKS